MRFDPCVFKNQASGCMYKPALHRDLSRIRGSMARMEQNWHAALEISHQTLGFWYRKNIKYVDLNWRYLLGNLI
jgi:hypothetical protein